jgi:hypothetical protein
VTTPVPSLQPLQPLPPVQPVQPVPSGDGAGSRGAPARALRLLQHLPDLVLLLGAVGGVVTALFVVAGQVAAVPVLAASLLLTVLAAQRLAPLRVAPDRQDALASLVVLVLVGVWVAANAPYVSESLFVSRDPSVFTLSAVWISQEGSPLIDPGDGRWTGSGFEYGADGLLRSQNTHVVPALAAVAGSLLGQRALLSAGLVVGAAVLVGMYALTRRIAGPWWALAATAGLGLGLPALTVTRGLYTEPLTTLFVLAAATVLAAGARRTTTSVVVAAGLCAGGAAMVRIDGSLVVAGLVPVVALLAWRREAVDDGDAVPRTIRAVAVFVASAAVPAALGAIDLVLWTAPSYLQTHGPAYLPAGALVLVAAAGAVVVAVLAGRAVARAGGDRPGVVHLLHRLEPAMVAVTGLVCLALVTAPLWRTGRNLDRDGPYADAVLALQVQHGLPVDPTRSYDELAAISIAWYQGWPALLLGLLGAVAMLRTGFRSRAELLVVPALVLPLLCVYVVDLGITPDQIWASRRLVAVVVPLLLVGAAWTISRLWGLGGWARPSAAVLAGSLVLAPLMTVTTLFEVPIDGGGAGLSRELCDMVGDDVVVVAGPSPALAPTIAVVCGSTVITSPIAAIPENLAWAEQFEPRQVTVVSSYAESADWQRMPTAPTLATVLSGWERTLVSEPSVPGGREIALYVGRVGDDGRLVQEPPPAVDEATEEGVPDGATDDGVTDEPSG